MALGPGKGKWEPGAFLEEGLGLQGSRGLAKESPH